MNPYETLGLDETADADAIKKAYRAKAKATHPDIQDGDRAAFENVNRAYVVLRDPESRAHYDATGEIRDEHVDALQENALVNVAMAFEQVIADCMRQGIDMTTVDLIGRMRSLFEAKRDERRQQRESVEHDRRTWEEMRGRFTVREEGQPNRFAAIVDDKLRKIDAALGQLAEADRIADAALAILDVHDYHFDQPDQDMQLMQVKMEMARAGLGGSIRW